MAEFGAILLEAMAEKWHESRVLSLQVKNSTNDRWKLVACEKNQGDWTSQIVPDILEPGQIATLCVTASGWWTAAEGTLLYKKANEPDNAKYCCILHYAINPWSSNNFFDTGVPADSGYVGIEEPSIAILGGWWQGKQPRGHIAVFRDNTLGMYSQRIRVTIDVKEK